MPYQKKLRTYLELDSNIILKEKNILEYPYIQKDETVIKVGSEYIWVWVAIEPKDKEILGISISKERNMFVAEHFLSDVVEDYCPHPVSTDGDTWYPQACKFLKINHHIHFLYTRMRKALLKELCNIKDRTECVDNYFPCRKKKCKLKHVINWLNLFVDYHNKDLS